MGLGLVKLIWIFGDIAKKKRWVIDRRLSPPASFGGDLYNFNQFAPVFDGLL
jgi:hypothetical protein